MFSINGQCAAGIADIHRILAPGGIYRGGTRVGTEYIEDVVTEAEPDIHIIDTFIVNANFEFQSPEGRVGECTGLVL